jgi:hypothetical protein
MQAQKFTHVASKTISSLPCTQNINALFIYFSNYTPMNIKNIEGMTIEPLN